MPWQTFGGMMDGELHALYDYLEEQPARPSQQRLKPV
jgi:hypothetical protein